MRSSTEEHDRILVQRCLASDEEAWNELFSTHANTISFVGSWRKWGFRPDEVEDVKQDIMHEIVRSLDGFAFRSSLRTFVYKISVNTCIARLRKRTALKRIPDGDCVSLDTIGVANDEDSVRIQTSRLKNQEEILSERETISLLRHSLASLGEGCRRLIRLRYWSELSFREIARILEAKENTLVVQLKRCLARLLTSFLEEAENGRV
jgi:RNA polymerase sigma-70 factor (ECF subfamily)